MCAAAQNSLASANRLLYIEHGGKSAPLIDKLSAADLQPHYPLLATHHAICLLSFDMPKKLNVHFGFFVYNVLVTVELTKLTPCQNFP